MKVLIEKNEISLFESTILDEDLKNGGSIFVGRQEDCHIILDDYQISRHHAILFIENNTFKIKVYSPENIIHVDGVKSQESVLELNSRINIGDFTITLILLPELLPLNIGNSIDDIPEDDLPTSMLSEATEVDEEVTTLAEKDLDSDSATTFDASIPPEVTEESFGEEDDSEDDSFSSEFNEEFSEEDSFNDGFSDDSFSGESTSDQTQVISSFANYTLHLLGEYTPFDQFSIDKEEVFIGRDPEKCQIVLNDPEVSMVHAGIKRDFLKCVLEDFDSSNGTILNGKRIHKEVIRNNDEFVIGDTSFRVEVRSDIIEAEKGRLMAVEDGQEIEIEEVVEEEVNFDSFDAEGGAEEAIEEKSLIKKIMKDPKKKRIAIGVILLFLVLLLLDEEKPTNTVKAKKKVTKTKKKIERKNYSEEIRRQLAQNYELAQSKYNQAIQLNERSYLSEAKEYINFVLSVDPQFANNGASTLSKMIQEQSDVFARLEAEEAAEIERRKIQLRVSKLLDKLRSAVKKRELLVCESLFGQILEIDPENLDVPPLKLEIESYKKEQERKKFEEQRKKAERQRMLDALAPGKTLFLKGEWYKSIDRLESFIRLKNIDEDLVKEGTSMLKKSRRNLLSEISPLLSKARSFKEGEDLKQSYETYGEVLRKDPSSEEALAERDQIFQTLRNRSMRLYREALVAESLSLFAKAKEKFQEVQQISPINSEYYNKASNKLKNYLE